VTDLRWWLENFQRSAFRLETLPAYQVPQEAEWFAEWRRSGRVPELTPQNDSWCKLVSNARSAGRLIQRVRVVSSPRSDYERFELEMFRHSLAAGEDIRILSRLDFLALGDCPDFWTIDGQIIVLHYDAVGRFLGVRSISGADVTRYRRIGNLAMSRSVSLEEYLAKL
jgi:hypothetical protein